MLLVPHERSPPPPAAAAAAAASLNFVARYSVLLATGKWKGEKKKLMYDTRTKNRTWG